MERKNYLAKPNQSIYDHYICLLKELDVLINHKYITDEKIIKLIKKSCEYHDDGKANREFQKRIKNKSKFNPNIEIAHNVLSLYFINKKDFFDMDDYYKVAYSVLNHHDYCDTNEVLNEEKDIINSLLNDFSDEVTSITLRDINKINKAAYDNDTIVIKGILHKCDYSASARLPIEYKNDFLELKLNSLLNEWKKHTLNIDWNELQKFAINNKNDNLIIIAQTGMGKTEAGLHWIGNNKGFFILPIRTAINAIYDRIKNNILENENIDERLALLHSETMSYYSSDEKINENEIDIDSYYNKTKQLSMPINISTLDQLFNFVFKYNGYEMKLATLAYSKIVIDEIQMYSPDLLAYLIYGISRIIELGGKIAILTATLPDFVKDLIIRDGFKCETEASYFINDNILRHNVKVIEKKIDFEDILKIYVKNKKDKINNKILVVCNTVKKAQEVYLSLKENMIGFDEELNILHNKFIKSDRKFKEEQIIKVGQTYDENGYIDFKNVIWVSTSLVEASLDIDFDFLFAELSDINSLFQRFGRCNRKGKKDIKNYNCFVFTEIESSLLINGKKGFIDKKIYEISKEAISKIDGILLESEKIDLIKKYLTMENMKKSDYIRRYEETYNFISNLQIGEMQKSESELRNILSYEIMPKTVYESNVDKIESIINEIKNISSIFKKVDEVEKKKLYIRKINLKDEIRKYTLGVQPYQYKKANVYNRLEIDKGEYIEIYNCNYDEIGFTTLEYKTEDYFL